MKESLRQLQWCPHRRTTLSFDPPGPPGQIEVTGGNNSMTTGVVGSPQIEVGTCIGSRCSQWRWDYALALSIVEATAAATWTRGSDGMLWRVEPLPRPPGVDASYVWRPVLGRWDRLIEPALGDRDGHCGLSGSPGPD